MPIAQTNVGKWRILPDAKTAILAHRLRTNEAILVHKGRLRSTRSVSGETPA